MDMLHNTSNGNITTTTDGFVKMPLWVAIIALLLALTVIVVSILGNCLVLATFIKFRRIITVYNIFALFLCITDLCVGFFTAPMFIWSSLYLHFKEKHSSEDDIFLQNERLCLFNTFFDFAPLILSEATLFLMAVERTIAVFFPLALHAKIRMWHAVSVCVIVWTGIILTYVIDMIVDLQINEEIHKSCDQTFLSPGVQRFTYTFSICLIVLCWILYIAILICLCIKKSNETISPSSERKATKMTAAVLIAFTCSFLPINVASFVGIPDPKHEVPLDAILLCLLYANSAVNPFIYNNASVEFRYAFRKLLTNRLKIENVPETMVSKTEDINKNEEISTSQLQSKSHMI